MEMMNRLVEHALDSQKFVDQIKRGANMANVLPERYSNETRAERRERERSEKKQAWRKLKSHV